MSFQIITGSGFTTNAQRIINDGSFNDPYGVGAIFNSGYTLLLNYKYDLSFKQRNSDGMYVFLTPSGDSFIYQGVNYNMSEVPFFPFYVEPNTGDAILFSSGFTALPDFQNYINVEEYYPEFLGFSVGEFSYPGGETMDLDEINLTYQTTPNSPSCSTLYISDVTKTGVTFNGLVNPYDLLTNSYFRIWRSGFDVNVAADQNPSTGTENIPINVTYALTSGLYYECYTTATNSSGDTTGNTIFFYSANNPDIYCDTNTSNSPTNFSETGITLRANVTNYWLSNTIEFEYGTTLSYGSSVEAIESPLTGRTFYNISANLTGLSPDDLYYYRIKVTNDFGVFYKSGYTFRTIDLGATFQGGIVYYFTSPNTYNHSTGLISTTDDQSAGAIWGCSGTELGATGFTGAINTPIIIDGCATAGIAARICADLDRSGYTDWVLPSVGELSSLCSRKIIVEVFLIPIIGVQMNTLSQLQIMH